MKKIIFASLLFVASLPMLADDYQYLTVAHASVEQSIELASIQKITFDTQGGHTIVTTTEGEVRFPISEMEKMFFSATPTAIKSLPAKSDNLSYAKGKLNVDAEGVLYIYAASGQAVRMAKVDGKTSISLSNLPKGTYIVKLGSQTIKIQK